MTTPAKPVEDHNVADDAVAEQAVGAPVPGHTEVAGGNGHGPELLGLNAEGWVYAGLTIFLLLAFTVGRAWQRIAAGLDARIVETRRSLDEAAALRVEAAKLLKDAKSQQAESANDAKALIAGATREAEALVAKAKTDASDLIARRKRMAEDRIGAAERQAVAEVRAKAVDAATAASAALIAEKVDAGADKRLIDEAISGI